MSLQQAITDIADRIDGDVANAVLDNLTVILLKGLSRELRTAVKSSEGIPPPIQQVFPPHEVMIEKEREKIRRERAAKGEEEPGERMVEIVGPDNGEVPMMIAIDTRMAQGYRTMVGASVYILGSDDKLHLSKEETEKYQQRKGSHD